MLVGLGVCSKGRGAWLKEYQSAVSASDMKRMRYVICPVKCPVCAPLASFVHTHTLSHSLSLSLSHTHTHTHVSFWASRLFMHACWCVCVKAYVCVSEKMNNHCD
jgi:hypothetical protein